MLQLISFIFFYLRLWHGLHNCYSITTDLSLLSWILLSNFCQLMISLLLSKFHVHVFLHLDYLHFFLMHQLYSFVLLGMPLCLLKEHKSFKIILLNIFKHCVSFNAMTVLTLRFTFWIQKSYVHSVAVSSFLFHFIIA